MAEEKKKPTIDQENLKEAIRNLAPESELSDESLERVAGGLAGKLNAELEFVASAAPGGKPAPAAPAAPMTPGIIKYFA